MEDQHINKKLCSSVCMCITAEREKNFMCASTAFINCNICVALSVTVAIDVHSRYNV